MGNDVGHVQARALLALLLFACPSLAVLTLPSIFSDNCILQTNAEYGARSSVYGWCEPGEQVTVALSDGQHPPTNYTSTCGADSSFQVTLNPIGEGQLLDLHVSGSVSTNSHTATGCQGGDVYLCGGQSNMCFSAECAFNASALVNVSHPNLRLFSVVMEAAPTPQRDFVPPNSTTQCTWNHDVVKGTGYPCNQWSLATPETQGKFSAVCLFAALQIAAQHTGARPIGLVYSAYGGTSINLWAPPQVYQQAQCPEATAEGGGLWNAMINPLVHYSLRAVLFFQGEADSMQEIRAPGYYSCRFAALIDHWRAAWGMGDFAFAFVQLGPVLGAPASGTGDLRYAQATVLPHSGGAVDTTGMAAAYDLGDASSPYDSVHFRSKVEVGRRLAAAVLHTAFALQNASLLPPRVVGAAAAAAAGSAVVLTVETLDGGGIGEVDGGQCTACCKGGGSVGMFQLAADRQGPWVAAASVAYDGGGLLSNITITPAAAGHYSLLRFAYQPYPQCAILGTGNGLPLPAFLVNITAAAPAAQAAVAGAGAPPSAQQQQPASAASSLVWRGRRYEWKDSDPKPPLGWNHWNSFHTNVDELLVLATAQAFVSLGLRDLSWNYINIDDGWQVSRNASGYIVEDPVRFPSGIPALSAAVHALGLKFGLYTSATSLTCQKRPGSYEMEALDAASYCAFGLDYIKIDNCGGSRFPQSNTSWIAFRKGLTACSASGGRQMAMSVEYCKAGQADGCSQWISGLADLWRTTGDVQANWASVVSNLELNNAAAAAARAGKYNDPDMLVAGLPGISLTEAQSQLSAFAVACAPMLLSLDLTQPLAPGLLGMLSNREVLAVGQDEGRVQGVRVWPLQEGDQECWARPLAGGGALAVLLLNKADSAAGNISCAWGDLGIPLGQQAAVRDLVLHTDLPPATGAVVGSNIPAHGSMLLKLTW